MPALAETTSNGTQAPKVVEAGARHLGDVTSWLGECRRGRRGHGKPPPAQQHRVQWSNKPNGIKIVLKFYNLEQIHGHHLN